MFKFICISLLCVSLLFSGCASMINGTTQMVPVTTTPNGAKVTEDGALLGETPFNYEFPRKKKHILNFSKEGYQDEQKMIEQKISGVYFVNAAWGLLGVIIGSIVDFSNGAGYKLVPKTLHVNLTPVGEVKKEDVADATKEGTEQKRIDENSGITM